MEYDHPSVVVTALGLVEVESSKHELMSMRKWEQHLKALAHAQKRAEGELAREVGAARKAGLTWTVIAKAVGLKSPQAAAYRWGKRKDARGNGKSGL